MMTVLALIRKNLLEIRLMLFLIASTLFGFAWLFVFITRRIETGASRSRFRGPSVFLGQRPSRTWRDKS